MHFENKKLKKTGKLNAHFKKMILIEYKNHSIYHLYDKESNLIFVSCSIDVNKNSMLKNLTIAEIYKVKFSIFENSTTEFFAAESVKFDASESHEIKSSQINKSINELIFKHMTSSVRNKYKSKNKMSSSLSQIKVLKIRCKKLFTKKKNIMNLTIMSIIIMK